MYRDFIAAGGITLPALCLQDESTDSESEKGKQAAAASPPSVVRLSMPPLPPARVKAPAAVAESSGTALPRPPKRPRTGAVHRRATASSRKASPPKPTATDMSTLS